METVDILFLIAFVFVLISGVYSFIIRKEIEKNASDCSFRYWSGLFF